MTSAKGIYSLSPMIYSLQLLIPGGVTLSMSVHLAYLGEERA